MHNQPLVTIGIPVYNRPEYLHKAIESVLNQTYKNIEIIISDNCSTHPEVRKICHDYAQMDSRIKYFVQQENIGMAPNLTFVVEKATGEYFIWCMDDDWLSENYVEESLKFLTKNPSYSFAFGNRTFYDNKYNFDRKCLRISYKDKDAFKRIKKYCESAKIACLSFGLAKTEDVKRVLTTRNRMPEDWIWVIKWLFLGKGKFLKKISYNALNIGISSDFEKVKETFNLPELTLDNYWETLSQIVSDSILNDDFFVERLDEQKRRQLAAIAGQSLLDLKKEHQLSTIPELLKYTRRHPLFIFKKKFYICLQYFLLNYSKTSTLNIF